MREQAMCGGAWRRGDAERAATRTRLSQPHGSLKHWGYGDVNGTGLATRSGARFSQRAAVGGRSGLRGAWWAVSEVAPPQIRPTLEKQRG